MSQFSLSWDSYKSNICSGFSALQQNGEFVDMTIAADGHLVKVHQVLVALASPYLKDLIASAPCQHPVIFLNNISHKVLCYILEYIYTGEVIVPSECLHSFTATAKALCIRGLESINSDATQNEKVSTPTDCPQRTTITDYQPKTSIPEYQETYTPTVAGVKRKASQPLEKVDQIMLPRNARRVVVKNEHGVAISEQVYDSPDNADTFPNLDENVVHDSDEEYTVGDAHSAENTDKVKSMTSNLLFTISIRGSLQVILNRYIYNLNSSKYKSGVRKWRCSDYRNMKCTAFLITKGNVVVNRANPHNHAFHDKKILAKIEKKSVFSAIDDVEAYRDTKKDMENEATVNESDFNSFEDSFKVFTNKDN